MNAAIYGPERMKLWFRTLTLSFMWYPVSVLASTRSYIHPLAPGSSYTTFSLYCILSYTCVFYSTFIRHCFCNYYHSKIRSHCVKGCRESSKIAPVLSNLVVSSPRKWTSGSPVHQWEVTDTPKHPVASMGSHRHNVAGKMERQRPTFSTFQKSEEKPRVKMITV